MKLSFLFATLPSHDFYRFYRFINSVLQAINVDCQARVPGPGPTL